MINLEMKYILLILLACSIPLLLSCFFQYKLAKKCNHLHKWIAFVPVLNTIQRLQLARWSGWWILVFLLLSIIPIFGWLVLFLILIRVNSDLSEQNGERRSFGLLFFIPFFSLWAGWKIAKNESFIFVEDEHLSHIVREINKGLSLGIDLENIQEKAISQGIIRNDFNTALGISEKSQKLNIGISNLSNNVVGNAFNSLVFSIWIVAALSLLVFSFYFFSDFYLDNQSKLLKLFNSVTNF